MKKTLTCLCVLFVLTSMAEEDISDLTWMEGSWIGAMGPNTIEEIWSKPKSGSLQATVRISSDSATMVHEVVVISKQESGIVLYLQQWGPTFDPLGPKAVMSLESMTENSVTFAGDANAMVQKLTYERAAADSFLIKVTTKGQPEFVMALSPSG